VLRFRVLRQGGAIGSTQFTIEAAGAALEARVETEIAVRLAGLTVFRFTQRFHERWQEGRLVAAEGRRDRNGTVTEMSARAEAGAVVTQGPEGGFRLAAEAAPLSWWDPTRFGRPLFATDTGKPLGALAVARRPRPGGGEFLRVTGAGEESEAQYDAAGVFVAWWTRAEDGSVVSYERIG
jgi:hypothetical protein